MTPATQTGDDHFSTPNEYVGIFLQRSDEGEAVARVLGDEGVEVIFGITYIECRAKNRLHINFDEISEELGIEIDGYWLQTQMSAHYGRFILNDEEVLLVDDPNEMVDEVG
ncbi:MAG: monooxygenase [Conexibacter sp.]|nr:monooxygenase [Conexibacter sp.]